MTFQKLLYAVLFSSAFMAACMAAQITPAPQEKPATEIQKAIDWPVIMKDLEQSNPEMFAKIKTETPLFFDWATHTKWQRRGKNALTMIAAPAVMHELWVQITGRSPLDKTRLLKSPPLTLSLEKTVLTRSLLMHTPSFFYNILRTSDLPITLKEIVSIRLIVYALTIAGELAGSTAGRYSAQVKTADILEKIRSKNRVLYNYALNILPEHINDLANLIISGTGMITAEVAGFFLIRRLLQKKLAKLKEQVAQVTQWLADRKSVV